jgi:hypothetical protein
MISPFSAADVLGAMITPAVLISASGTLVLSTSNRLTRVVDRVRTLSSEAEALLLESESSSHEVTDLRRKLISDQLPRLADRALLLRSALTALYTAIGLLVATSLGVGFIAVLGGRFGWLAVLTGLAGGCMLLYGSILLVREARMAVASNFQEMAFVREVLERTRGRERG